MPPSRNNTVKFTDLQPISSVNPGDIIPVVDTSVPTLVNKKINVQDFSRSLPVSQQVIQMGAVSGSWDSTYTTTQSNSATWGTGGTYGTVYSENSAKYESAYSNVLGNSANWNSAYATVQSSSAAWTGLTTYTTVQENSAGWESVESTVLTNSASWIGGNSAYTTINSLSDNYWLLKAGDQVTGALTTTKALTTQFTNSEEFVSKRYADALALQAQVSGNFVPALYFTKTESDDRFFNQGENTLLAQNLSAFTDNTINIHSNTLILSSQNNASNSPLLRLSRFGAGLYFDGARCLIRGDNWGDGDAGFIQLVNSVTIGRSLTNPGIHVNVTNPKVFILGNNTESGIAFSRNVTYEQSDTSLMREESDVLAVRPYSHTAGINNREKAFRIYRTFTDSNNFERLSLSATRIQTEFAGTGRAYDLSITAAGSGNLVLSGTNFNIDNRGRLRLTDPQAVNYVPGIYSGTASIVQGVGDWSFSCRGNSPLLYLQGNSKFVMIDYLGALAWDNQLNTGQGIPDVSIYRESVGILGQRGFYGESQGYRIYNTYTDANNWERLSLSATRIAYERTGTGSVRDLTITTPGNLILSGASVQINSQLPFYYASLSASKLTFDRGPAPISNPHISVPAWDNNYWISDNSYSSIWGGSGPSLNFNTQYNNWYMGIASRINGIPNTVNLNLHRDLAICWSPSTTWNETGDLFLFKDAPWTLAIRNRAAQNFTNALRIYNNYTDANNYERLSLSGTQIVFENAGTGSSRNFNITNRAWTLNWGSGGLTAEKNGIQHINLAGISRVVIHRDYALAWSENPYTDQYSGDTFLYRDGAGILALNKNNGASPGVYRIYNTYTDTNNYERLSLSATRIAYEFAGTGVSRDLTIQSTGNIILSAGGAINLSQALPTMFDNLSARILTVGPANAGTGTSGSLRIANDTSGVLYPGIYSTGNGISLATYGNGGLSNVSSSFMSHLLAGRSVFSAAQWPVVNPTNFDETIPNIAIKVGGNIGFTVPQLDGSNFVRPISATMGYDWGTNLINLSGRAGKVGFRFDSVEAGNNRPEIYNNGHLVITSNFGGGRRIYFNGVDNQGWNPFELGYNGAFAYGTIEITATQQPGTYTFPYLKITQASKQLSSYIQAVNVAGSTVFEVTSANNVVVRNLLALGGTTASNAAIKASGTTVVAKLGDDSDYAFLQGKLQTLNTAAAGTFTPDRYLILYDSTGTAYKVPVQAL